MRELVENKVCSAVRGILNRRCRDPSCSTRPIKSSRSPESHPTPYLRCQSPDHATRRLKSEAFTGGGSGSGTSADRCGLKSESICWGAGLKGAAPYTFNTIDIVCHTLVSSDLPIDLTTQFYLDISKIILICYINFPSIKNKLKMRYNGVFLAWRRQSMYSKFYDL